MTVIYPRAEAHFFETLSKGFPWVRWRLTDSDARVAAAFRNVTGKAAPTGVGKSHLVPGVGYVAQILDKMHADSFVPTSDYIICFDSDTFLPRPLLPEHLFNTSSGGGGRSGGKGGGSSSSRSSSGTSSLTPSISYYPLMPAMPWPKGGSEHENFWRGRTAEALGVPRDVVQLSFMARGGGLLFPSWLFRPLRARMLHVHNESLYSYAARKQVSLCLPKGLTPSRSRSQPSPPSPQRVPPCLPVHTPAGSAGYLLRV